MGCYQTINTADAQTKKRYDQSLLEDQFDPQKVKLTQHQIAKLKAEIKSLDLKLEIYENKGKELVDPWTLQDLKNEIYLKKTELKHLLKERGLRFRNQEQYQMRDHIDNMCQINEASRSSPRTLNVQERLEKAKRIQNLEQIERQLNLTANNNRQVQVLKKKNMMEKNKRDEYLRQKMEEESEPKRVNEVQISPKIDDIEENRPKVAIGADLDAWTQMHKTHQSPSQQYPSLSSQATYSPLQSRKIRRRERKKILLQKQEQQEEQDQRGKPLNHYFNNFDEQPPNDLYAKNQHNGPYFQNNIAQPTRTPQY